MKSARWIVRAMLPVVALVCVGCPEETADSASSCVDDNPADGASAFESDMWGITCVSPYNEDAGLGTDAGVPACEPPTIEEIEAECAEDGHDCAGYIVVSKSAALCIARDAGLSEGLVGFRADLVYNYQYQLPIWSVGNVLVDDGADGSIGSAVAISAVDGTVLDRVEWAAKP